MSKVPALPKGLTLADFGSKVMRWGTGDAAADARINTLTLQELREASITAQIAEEWRLFYLAVIEENPKNPSARGRARLLERAKILLEENSK
jgi:hypothetical protein